MTCWERRLNSARWERSAGQIPRMLNGNKGRNITVTLSLSTPVCVSVSLFHTHTRVQGLKQQTSDLLALQGRDKTHPEWSHLCCWKAEQTVRVCVCVPHPCHSYVSSVFSSLIRVLSVLISYPSTHLNEFRTSFIHPVSCRPLSVCSSSIWPLLILRSQEQMFLTAIHVLQSMLTLKTTLNMVKWHARGLDHMVLTAIFSAPVF